MCIHKQPYMRADMPSCECINSPLHIQMRTHISVSFQACISTPNTQPSPTKLPPVHGAQKNRGATGGVFAGCGLKSIITVAEPWMVLGNVVLWACGWLGVDAPRNPKPEARALKHPWLSLHTPVGL